MPLFKSHSLCHSCLLIEHVVKGVGSKPQPMAVHLKGWQNITDRTNCTPQAHAAALSAGWSPICAADTLHVLGPLKTRSACPCVRPSNLLRSVLVSGVLCLADKVLLDLVHV